MDAYEDSLEPGVALLEADQDDPALHAIIDNLKTRDDDQPVATVLAESLEQHDWTEDSFPLKHEAGDPTTDLSLVCSAAERTEQDVAGVLLDVLNQIEAS